MFQGWPIVCSVYYSFLDWSGLTVQKDFVGLANYNELFHDELFWNAFANSFKFSILNVPFTLVISLFLAYILNNAALRGRTIYRTLFFIPVVTTAAIVGIIMIFIFGAQGPVNWVFLHLFQLDRPVNFLSSGKNAMGTVVAISVWKDCGTYMIYWIAGLQSVSKDMYEAASLDGATPRQTFFKIILPMIAPVAGIISVLCTINSLKAFDIIKTMTEGGPYFATDVMGTFVYRSAFSSEIGLPRLGYASSAALSFGLVVILVVVLLNSFKTKMQNNSNRLGR
jgi:multiple sugar transport system permease protein